MTRARVALALCAAVGACGGAPQTPPTWTRPGLESAVRPEMGPPQPGDIAPDFELPRLDGTPQRLSALRGSWVLLHFTASWCPFCDAEVAHLGDGAAAYAERGVKVVLVDVKEEQAHWQQYARARVAARVIALWDGDGAAAARFAPPGALPSFDDRSQVVLDGTLVIDPQGRIRLFLLANSKRFDPSFVAVRRELDALLGAPAPVESTATHAVEAPAALAPEAVVAISAAPVAPVARGASGEAQVTLRIAPGYHVMSNTPSDPLYIATHVDVADADGVHWSDARYPPATSFQLSSATISTFEGDVSVRVPFAVAADAAPGPRRFTGSVRYQACTASNCLFPVTRTIEVPLDVAP